MKYIKKIKFSFYLLVIIFLVTMQSLINQKSQIITVNYPKLQTLPVTESYFGQTVTDKFRSVENLEDPSVKKWLEEERILTDSILNRISYRDSIKTQLEAAMYSLNVRGGFPRTAGNKVFFSRRLVKEKMYGIFFKEDLKAPEIELFSTKKLNNKENTYTVDYIEPSHDGKFLAFGLSKNGDEKTAIRIIDVEKRIILSDSIPQAYYANIQWVPNSNCFFYTQLKEIKTEADQKTMYEDSKVKLHYLGKNYLEDKEVFSRALSKDVPMDKIDFPYVKVFPKSKFAIGYFFNGPTSYCSLYYTKLEDLLFSKENEIKWKLIETAGEKPSLFALYKDQVYVMDFKVNSNGILKKKDLSKDRAVFQTILEGNIEVLEDMMQTNSSIYVKKLKSGVSTITEINLSTNKMRDVILPYPGYVDFRPIYTHACLYLNSDLFHFSMESWNKEPTLLCHDPVTNKVFETGFRPISSFGNLDDIAVKEIEVPSKDGQTIPLSIIYSKKMKFDGNNPTTITAYGAYGVPINPVYDPSYIVWVRLGGVYAIAHVRGGNEKGDSWYRGGYKATKANSWKDFISCAEYLIKEKYTSPEKLSARGASAGGITVGMAITERPDLFKAALLKVPMTNMVRFENTNNTVNIAEFGSTKNSDEFKYLYGMDVYHNIKDGVNYPSVLLTGEKNDVRVALWQPAKAAARFQEVSDGKTNVVLFKPGQMGHSNKTGKVEEQTDVFSFLFWQLNHPKFHLR
jgi:prolyl oligopeptidase